MALLYFVARYFFLFFPLCPRVVRVIISMTFTLPWRGCYFLVRVTGFCSMFDIRSFTNERVVDILWRGTRVIFANIDFLLQGHVAACECEYSVKFITYCRVNLITSGHNFRIRIIAGFLYKFTCEYLTNGIAQRVSASIISAGSKEWIRWLDFCGSSVLTTNAEDPVR